MKQFLIVALTIVLAQSSSASTTRAYTMNHIGTHTSKANYFRKDWTTYVTINLGTCQASGTITVHVNESTGDIHVYYSLATNCGGGIHGTAGQFFRATINGDGRLTVDPDSITYEYDNADIQNTFESGNGKKQLIEGINQALATD